MAQSNSRRLTARRLAGILSSGGGDYSGQVYLQPNNVVTFQGQTVVVLYQVHEKTIDVYSSTTLAGAPDRFELSIPCSPHSAYVTKMIHWVTKKILDTMPPSYTEELSSKRKDVLDAAQKTISKVLKEHLGRIPSIGDYQKVTLAFHSPERADMFFDQPSGDKILLGTLNVLTSLQNVLIRFDVNPEAWY